MKLQGNEKKHGGGNYVMRKTAAKTAEIMSHTVQNFWSQEVQFIKGPFPYMAPL